MALHIIIDGYNLIRQSPSLSVLDQADLQLGREALVDMLAAYKKIKGHKITVVFDAMYANAISRHTENLKGIEVIFSRQGETADAVLKNLAGKERERALVVSSDHEILNAAESSGAATIASVEFEDRITMASYMNSKGLGSIEDEDTGWQPTTRKKGPKRRRSKKERKQYVKIKKI
ncbi:MAG: NYN domain-containing protein [Pseudomonadota bacterium]